MKNRTLLFFGAFLCLVLKSYAGEIESVKGKSQVGITFSSFGSNDLVSFQKIVGGPGYYGDGFYSFGLSYLYELNRTLDFETGIEYTEHKILIEPNLPLVYHGTTSHARFSLITLPASIRFNFLKFFFLSGGVFLDINGTNSTPFEIQKGLGINLGLGMQYKFNHGLSIFINPYSKFHSIFPSSNDQRRILESGFRFGILIRLNK